MDGSDNVLYTKFKDFENSSRQYIDASIDLNKKNNIFPKRICKPTHHIIIPIEENIKELPYIKGIYSEQKMITNFCDYLKKNIDKKQDEESAFVYEFSERIFKILCESDDSEVYREIFNTGNIKNNSMADMKKKIS